MVIKNIVSITLFSFKKIEEDPKATERLIRKFEI
jgi:hypothetical protein